MVNLAALASEILLIKNSEKPSNRGGQDIFIHILYHFNMITSYDTSILSIRYEYLVQYRVPVLTEH